MINPSRICGYVSLFLSCNRCFHQEALKAALKASHRSETFRLTRDEVDCQSFVSDQFPDLRCVPPSDLDRLISG